MYSKQVLDHFKNPRNYGMMKNPDGIGQAGNIICGDVMKLYIKVEKIKTGEEIIKDIKFETFGCAAAIANSSVLTELAKGKSLSEALAIGRRQIVTSLGGLPPVKIHCSILAADALAEAIYDYLSKIKKPIPIGLEKRHKRIEKERKIIEEKYKGWISDLPSN